MTICFKHRKNELQNDHFLAIVFSPGGGLVTHFAVPEKAASVPRRLKAGKDSENQTKRSWMARKPAPEEEHDRWEGGKKRAARDGI